MTKIAGGHQLDGLCNGITWAQGNNRFAHYIANSDRVAVLFTLAGCSNSVNYVHSASLILKTYAWGPLLS